MMCTLSLPFGNPNELHPPNKYVIQICVDVNDLSIILHRKIIASENKLLNVCCCLYSYWSTVLEVNCMLLLFHVQQGVKTNQYCDCW